LVPTWFEATREEQLAILELVDEVKAQLDAELRRLGPAEMECEGSWARRRCGDRAGTFCRAWAPRCGAAGGRQKAVEATGLAAPRPSRGGWAGWVVAAGGGLRGPGRNSSR
jgi:hypothetical protein